MDAVTRAVTTGEDLYGLLGVLPDASDDDIRHAYRALAREHHPDANPEDARADGFRRVAAAYEILGDERERESYDRALHLERLAAEQALRPGPVASHVAPRPTGAYTPAWPRGLARMRVARLRRRAGAQQAGEATMRKLLEITSDGDIIDDGEIYALFPFDPESLGDNPID